MRFSLLLLLSGCSLLPVRDGLKDGGWQRNKEGDEIVYRRDQISVRRTDREYPDMISAIAAYVNIRAGHTKSNKPLSLQLQTSRWAHRTSRSDEAVLWHDNRVILLTASVPGDENFWREFADHLPLSVPKARPREFLIFLSAHTSMRELQYTDGSIPGTSLTSWFYSPFRPDDLPPASVISEPIFLGLRLYRDFPEARNALYELSGSSGCSLQMVGSLQAVSCPDGWFVISDRALWVITGKHSLKTVEPWLQELNAAINQDEPTG